MQPRTPQQAAALKAAARPSILRELYDARWWLLVGVALSVALGLSGLFR